MTPQQFKQARKARKMNQKEIAEFLSASYSAVTKWETNQNPIPSWVEEKLRDRSGKFILDSLTPEEVSSLDKIAARKGVSAESLIADLVRAGLKFGLIALVCGHC